MQRTTSRIFPSPLPLPRAKVMHYFLILRVRCKARCTFQQETTHTKARRELLSSNSEKLIYMRYTECILINNTIHYLCIYPTKRFMLSPSHFLQWASIRQVFSSVRGGPRAASNTHRLAFAKISRYTLQRAALRKNHSAIASLNHSFPRGYQRFPIMHYPPNNSSPRKI